MDRAERLAEHQLHRDEILLGFAADLERADDVRMDQPREQPSFVEEHLHEPIVLGDVVAHDLQRDHAGEVGIGIEATTEVDGAHSAAGDLRDHLPLTEARRTVRAGSP